MDRAWRVVELATTVTELQSAKFPYVGYIKETYVYVCKVDTTDELFQRMFYDGDALTTPQFFVRLH
jgi:hypothetical protein